MGHIVRTIWPTRLSYGFPGPNASEGRADTGHASCFNRRSGSTVKRSPSPPPHPSGARLRGLLIILALFFVLPAALFLRLIGSEGTARVAAMILALTLPATGAVILRLNPDLLPELESLKELAPGEWIHLIALAALLLVGIWWLTTALAPA